MGWQLLIILRLLVLTGGSHISCSRCYALYTSYHQEEQLWESCYITAGADEEEGWVEIDTEPTLLLNGFAAQHQHEKLWQKFSNSVNNESLYMQVVFWNASNARRDILNVSVTFHFGDDREDSFNVVAQLLPEELRPALALMCSTKEFLKKSPRIVLKGKADLVTITNAAVKWGTKEASTEEIKWTENQYLDLNKNHHLALKLQTANKLCKINNLSFKLVNDKNEIGCAYKDIQGIVNHIAGKKEMQVLSCNQGNVVFFHDVPSGRYHLKVAASADTTCSVWNFGETPGIEVSSSRKLLDPSQFRTKMSLTFNAERKSASVKVDFPGGEYGCMQNFDLSLYRFTTKICGPNDSASDITTRRVFKIASEDPQSREYTFKNVKEESCYMAYIIYNYADKLECDDFVDWTYCPWGHIRTEGKYLDLLTVDEEDLQQKHINIILVASLISCVGVLIIIVILGCILCKKKKKQTTEVSDQNPSIYRRLLVERKENSKLKVLLVHANDDERFALIVKAFRSFLETELHCKVWDIHDYSNEMSEDPVIWIRNKIASPKYKVIVVISEKGCSLEKSSWETEPIEKHALFRLAISGIPQRLDPFKSVFVVRFSGVECSALRYKYVNPELIYHLTQHLVSLDMALHNVIPTTSDIADLSPEAVWPDNTNLTSLISLTMTQHPLHSSNNSSFISINSDIGTPRGNSGFEVSSESETENLPDESDRFLPPLKQQDSTSDKIKLRGQQQCPDSYNTDMETLLTLLGQQYSELDLRKVRGQQPHREQQCTDSDNATVENLLVPLGQQHSDPDKISLEDTLSQFDHNSSDKPTNDLQNMRL